MVTRKRPSARVHALTCLPEKYMRFGLEMKDVSMLLGSSANAVDVECRSNSQVVFSKIILVIRKQLTMSNLRKDLKFMRIMSKDDKK